MKIEPTSKEHLVTDYDLITASGIVMPITIDPEAGDYFLDTLERLEFYQAPRPSLSDPDETIPAETTVVYKRHLIAYQYRERKFVELTPDQKFELQETLQKLTKTVQ